MCLAEERERYDTAFLKSCGIAVADAPARVTVEIVMQGAVVRKVRERHAMRKRKPLMGERKTRYRMRRIGFGRNFVTNDIVLQLMIEKGVPLTRENYLHIAYMGNPPEEIGGEIEASIPKEIGEAEDVQWMAEMGVGWVPEKDDDED